MKWNIAMLVAALVACGNDGPDAPRVEVAAADVRSLESGDVVGRWSLELGSLPSGITVEPDTGRRLVLYYEGRIVELASGVELGVFVPPFVRTGFADVAALGRGLLALTAVSDGYIASLVDGSLVPHFCYEPGWFDDELDAVQLSGALAVDVRHDRLFTQPLTVTNGGFGTTVEGFFSTYDLSSGVDTQWWRTPDPSFVATGMVVLDAGETPEETTLLVARGDRLLRFDVASRALTPLVSLAEVGLSFLNGIARDDVAGTLLVVGSGEDLDVPPEVVEIPLDAVLQRH